MVHTALRKQKQEEEGFKTVPNARALCSLHETLPQENSNTNNYIRPESIMEMC